jgi:hypothetical protein
VSFSVGLKVNARPNNTCNKEIKLLVQLKMKKTNNVERLKLEKVKEREEEKAGIGKRKKTKRECIHRHTLYETKANAKAKASS